MNVEPYADGVAILGETAPPPPDRIDELLRYLATVRKRFGNTAVSYRVRWGASALWAGELNEIRIHELECALVESVKLQSHYAQLLNGYDGGERMQFETAQAWLDRLRALQADRTNLPTRVMQRDQMVKYERLLKTGVRFKWIGANGREYLSTLITDCVNGNYRAMDDGGTHEGHIERVTEIWLPHETIVIQNENEGNDPFNAPKPRGFWLFREILPEFIRYT